MSDIDLWCRREDESTLRETLERLGYVALGHLDGAFARLDGSSSVHVDVHTSLSPWPDRDLEPLFQRTFAIHGSDLRVLSIEDQILFTAHHAVGRHAHIRESWKSDLRELVTVSHDADLIVEEARRLDVTEIVRIALEHCAPDSALAMALRKAPGTRSIRGALRRFAFRRALRGSEVEARARIATLLTTKRPLAHLYRLILPPDRELAGRHGEGTIARRRARRLRSLAERAVRSIRNPE